MFDYFVSFSKILILMQLLLVQFYLIIKGSGLRMCEYLFHAIFNVSCNV